MTRLLFIGDIVAKPGRELLRRGLGAIVVHHQIDLVIANVENAAAGFGVTPEIADDLLSYGVHVMTGGNHTWDKKEIFPYFARQPRLLRPANLPAGAPGRGVYVARTARGVPVAVINIMGRVFMTAIDDPFKVVLEEIDAIRQEALIVFVDFHAEATSEKVAMGWHLDGRATAVAGTHTHVQTADERVLPQGTAYITDVGMTGPHDSVIGVDRSAILQRFLTALPQRFEAATENPRLNAVLVDADEATGRATQITRLSLSASEIDTLAAKRPRDALVSGHEMDDWQELPFEDEPAREPRWLTVSALSARLKTALESAFSAVAVEGEISNCKQWSSGHLYFTLKDDHAQIRAVMFRKTAERLRFKPEDGMHVLARGRISLYEVKGEYQIVVDALEPHGLGALQAAFEQLKRKLQAEGLFDTARKRELPVLPRRIGVVTSLDGAAVRDILRVLTRRYPTARVVIRPAKVQGFGAAQDLVRALRAIARVPDIDVVIIGRGGGSSEDLWAFNDETLARAIVACPVPVIAAIGHEVDFTIADFVADVRAATPSNAAELVVDRADNFRTRIERATRGLDRAARAALGGRRQAVDRLGLRLRHWPVAVVMRERDRQELHLHLSRALAGRLSRAAQRLDGWRRRLERRDVRHITAELQTRLVRADGRMQESLTRRRLAADARVRMLAGRLEALSPLAVLARGYAVCWNEARTSIIRSASAAAPGERVHVTLAEGELTARVEGSRLKA